MPSKKCKRNISKFEVMLYVFFAVVQFVQTFMVYLIFEYLGLTDWLLEKLNLLFR